MQQRHSVIGRPSGTDGSDFSYRMVVDSSMPYALYPSATVILFLYSLYPFGFIRVSLYSGEVSLIVVFSRIH